MSEANGKLHEGRSRTGQFLPGHKSTGGRPLGSRNKLSEKFLADVERVWKKKGAKALERVADETPDILVKVVASLMPRQLIAQSNVNVDINLFNEAQTFAEAFRVAKDFLNIEGSAEPRLIESMAEPEEDADAALSTD